MTILVMEGFDHFPTDTVANESMLNDVSGYTVVGLGNVSIDNTIMHHDQGKSLRIYSSGTQYLTIGVGAAVTNTIFCSFGVYMDNPSHTNTFVANLCRLLANDGYNPNVTLVWNSGGAIKVLGPTESTLYTGPTGLFSLQTWYWIEMKVYLHDSAGTVEVWVNGNKEVDLTTGTIDTKRDTIATVNGISFGISGSTAATFYYDNIVIQDDVGGLLGDSIIETFMPTGDESITWSNSTTSGTNASHISDTTTTVDDLYVYSNTSNDIDLYSVDTISASDTIHAVGVQYRAKKSATGTITIQSRSYDGTADTNGGAQNSLGIDFTGYDDVFETTNNEDTDDTTWTKALFDDAQFGLKVI